MKGINIDGINIAIKKADDYYLAVDEDVKHILRCINELNNLYSGIELQYLFQDVFNQVQDISMISEVVKNYSDILKNVKTSYQEQDNNLRYQINHITSKINM